MKAVLFDFDGVVANTMRLHVVAWTLAFKEFGMSLDESLIYINEGSPAHEIIRTLLVSCHRPADDPIGATLIARKDYYLSQMDLTNRMYPQFPKVLAAAKALSLKTAIVTGASRRNLNDMLSPEAASAFDITVTGDDTAHGKPSPDPYLTAANLLGFPPRECCVVENGPFGIQSAKAAGMRGVALCTTLGPDHLRDADVVLKGHAELLKTFSDAILQ